ncbi:MAG: PD-(D/E)XK nuclease family protein [bacterium]|nr:PD-(D/E)XK nuclease family protein [bacterium]
MKVKEKISQPSMPMPGVFSTMNSIMQGSVVGKKLKTISTDLPDGEVIKQEGFVKSKPIPGTSVFIGGKYDLLVQNPDGTYTIVDFKISKPDDGKAEKYQTQLGAYKFALENPESGEAIKVSRLGLLVFYPDTVSFENGVARLDFPPKWLEIPADDTVFLKLAREIDKLLSGPLPSEDPNCKWCAYRHLGENMSHHLQSVPISDEPF